MLALLTAIANTSTKTNDTGKTTVSITRAKQIARTKPDTDALYAAEFTKLNATMNTKQQQHKNKQRGFELIEVLLCVAIATIPLVVGTVLSGTPVDPHHPIPIITTKQ